MTGYKAPHIRVSSCGTHNVLSMRSVQHKFVHVCKANLKRCGYGAFCVFSETIESNFPKYFLHNPTEFSKFSKLSSYRLQGLVFSFGQQLSMHDDSLWRTIFLSNRNSSGYLWLHRSNDQQSTIFAIYVKVSSDTRHDLLSHWLVLSPVVKQGMPFLD